MEYNEEKELEKIKESYKNIDYLNDIQNEVKKQETPLEWRIASGIIIAFAIMGAITAIINSYQEKQAIKEINLMAKEVYQQIQSIQNNNQRAINNLLTQQQEIYQTPKTYYQPKKWKRTTWDVYKGKACKNEECLYSYERKYQDCLITTQQCYIQTRKFTSKEPMPQNKKITYL